MGKIKLGYSLLHWDETFFFPITGGSPYPKTDGKALASLLQEGYRMPRPPHLDEKL